MTDRLCKLVKNDFDLKRVADSLRRTDGSDATREAAAILEAAAEGNLVVRGPQGHSDSNSTLVINYEQAEVRP